MIQNSYEPLVSIIIPALNSEKTINDLLDSLMELNYKRDLIEIIIVDGGSTDKTREIAKKYPVKIVVEERKGINIARNVGVRNSHGEIIVFTDSDCVVPKDWIKKIVEIFEDRSVGCLGGSAVGYYDTLLSKYADESIIPVLKIFKKQEKLDRLKNFISCPAGCNMAFRREILEKAGLFDERLRYGFDELELVERMCELGYKMVLDNEIIVWHKHRENLRGILKQVFNYGMGGGLLINMGINGKFTKWTLQSLTAFLTWISLLISLTILTIINNQLFLIPLLSITILPITLLAVFYIVKAYRKERERIFEVLVYPIIDILRFIYFHFGVTYSIINRKKMKKLIESQKINPSYIISKSQ